MKDVGGQNVDKRYSYINLKKEFPKEAVQRLLLEEHYTYKDLQQKYHYNERLWSKLAKEYNIPKQIKNIRKKCNEYHTINIDNQLLIKLYIDEKYSIRQLAETFKCNKSTIKDRLEKNGIAIRPFNDKNYYKNRKDLNRPHISVDSSGYIHQMSQRQHRLIMEKFLGRKLTKNEHIHHIDFNKSNNDINNLFLFHTNDAHLSYHGYIKHHNYISPQEFMNNIYPNILYYKSKDFLYEQYVVLNKSVAQIEKEIDSIISRVSLTKCLKEYGLFVNGKHVNQYDT